MFDKGHLAVLQRSTPQPWNGRIPAKWVSALGVSDVPPAVLTYTKPLSRDNVYDICQDRSVDVLTAYWCVMAWGGQRWDHARKAWQHRSIIERKLLALRTGRHSPERAFALFKDGEQIPHLNVAYFTKLLFFFSPDRDHYILDQWTAKSINLLLDRPLIPLDGQKKNAVRRTTTEQYREYCEAVRALAEELSREPYKAEQLMFNGVPWREHVRAHYEKQKPS